MENVLLGIDQSLTSTALTVWDGEYHYYLFPTEKTKGTKCPTIDYTRRLMEIKAKVVETIEAHSVTLAALEGMAYGGQGRVVFDLGGLSHMIREAFFEKRVPFVIVPPTALKKFWTGNGKADKLAMVTEAEARGVEIPFLEKYKGSPDPRFNDDAVDSHALVEMLKECEKHAAVLERSWDL